MELMEALKAGANVSLIGQFGAGFSDAVKLLEEMLEGRCSAKPGETNALLLSLPLLIIHLGEKSSILVAEQCVWALGNAVGEGDDMRIILLTQGALLPIAHLMLSDKGSIIHLGEKSSILVAEQCVWALGNAVGEGDDIRIILLTQGALLPIAHLMLSDKGSTSRTTGWAPSNLIKGPDSKKTTDSGRIVGLNVQRIVNDSSAAALYYGMNNREGFMAVFDPGGGLQHSLTTATPFLFFPSSCSLSGTIGFMYSSSNKTHDSIRHSFTKGWLFDGL